jgi:hypothetical protein
MNPQEDGTFRSTVFYNTIGEYFVDIAYVPCSCTSRCDLCLYHRFRAAEAADPTVGLAANE